MKDEIKEINIPENVLNALGALTNGAMNYYEATETIKVIHNTILDYITNLQEENRDLSRMCELYSKSLYNAELTNYKSRNEKAIEKIKKIQENAIKYGANHDAIICQDLLNILQGDDKK